MEKEKKVRRTREMIQVAFFLSKYGATKPLVELGNVSWSAAYESFFNSFGNGRTLASFKNSLKNQRDVFDAWVDSSRQGWRQAGADQSPAALTTRHQSIFDELEALSRQDVWSIVQKYWLSEALISQVKRDLSAQKAAQTDKRAQTEGGKSVHVSYRIERNPKLRAAALSIHGYQCTVCDFDFGQAYGDWGEGYAEVHHLVQLGGAESGRRETDPKSDLVILCANCHRMVHRKQNVALTVAELRSKIDRRYLREWAGTEPTKASVR